MSQLVFMLLVLTIVVPFGIFLKGERKASRFKGALAFNIVSFFAVIIGATVLTFTGTASAAEAASATSTAGLAYIAAALSTGLACLGAGIAVAGGSSAAIGAISENESIMGKALIFVALGEGIAIYGLVITIMILGRV